MAQGHHCVLTLTGCTQAIIQLYLSISRQTIDITDKLKAEHPQTSEKSSSGATSEEEA
jgi:hypothetical protein